jgi:hypothetical protein
VSNPNQKQTTEAFYRRRSGAKKREKEFSLTLEQFTALYEKNICEYTGIKLVYLHDLKALEEGVVPDNMWSIDRINPSIGYVWGNVVVCSHKSNQLKGRYIDLDFQGTASFSPSAKISVKDAKILSQISYRIGKIEGYKMVSAVKKQHATDIKTILVDLSKLELSVLEALMERRILISLAIVLSLAIAGILTYR